MWHISDHQPWCVTVICCDMWYSWSCTQYFPGDPWLLCTKELRTIRISEWSFFCIHAHVIWSMIPEHYLATAVPACVRTYVQQSACSRSDYLRTSGFNVHKHMNELFRDLEAEWQAECRPVTFRNTHRLLIFLQFSTNICIIRDLLLSLFLLFLYQHLSFIYKYNICSNFGR